MIHIYNENCFDTMNKMVNDDTFVNIILTSPPYNTSRNIKTKRATDNHENRYDLNIDTMTNEDYIKWSIDLFNMYNKVLSKDGVILYNISYGNENPSLLWLVMSDIVRNTDFMIADCIIWKKKSALPNNVSKNKLTRITEFVFVICRKTEYSTYNMNKKVKSYSKTGQAYYENIYNFVEAKNNDGSCSLNKATYSTELCEKLLSMYSTNINDVVYDSFMGTGTTAVACKKLGLSCIGSELSDKQCEYAINRLEGIL